MVLGSPRRWDCPLAQSNAIILGEAMLKMNHLLATPRWPRCAHFSRTQYSEAIHPTPRKPVASLITGKQTQPPQSI